MIYMKASAERLLNLKHHFAFSTAKKHKYKFIYGSHMIPHPAKAYKGGEDAIFASDNLLVVADGVGGWAQHGVDPGKYSKRLCSIIGHKISTNFDKYIDNPKILLEESWKQNKEEGSTTICMLSMNPQTGILRSYYLGDSIYGIFREKEVEMIEEQQKSFNFPYQIGSQGDHPSQGVYYEFSADKLKQDEQIVMGTDGVWDNVGVEEIYKLVKKQENSLQNMAKEIAKRAQTLSLSENYESPFYKKAKECGLRTERSGKPDDISVIVARVMKEEL